MLNLVNKSCTNFVGIPEKDFSGNQIFSKIAHWFVAFRLKDHLNSDGKEATCMQETQVRFLGWGDPLEKGMATQSSIFAWDSMERGVWRAIIHEVTKHCT